jgi:GPH family glycoside/pentoside/hexuronide:cation symporter
VSAPPRLPIHTQARYAAAEVGLNAAETALRLYLLKYYTDGQGLAPSLAGIAFALGLLWDALIDPLMGVLSDRTAHRFGGRRFWILVGAGLLAVGLLAVFVPPALSSQEAKFAWLVGAGCLLNTGLTVVYVPYLATCNEMTEIPHERSVLFGWRFAAANVGAVVAVALPILFAGTQQGTVAAIPSTSVAIALIVLAGAAITWSTTRPRHVRPPPPRAPVLRGLLSTMRNRAFLPLLTAYVIASAGVGVNATTALYYYGYCLRLSDQQVQTLIAVFLVAFTLGLPLWLSCARRAGKLQPLVRGAAAVGASITTLYLLLPAGNFVYPLLFGAVGIGTLVGCVALIDSILTDVVDHDTVHTRAVRAGAFFGVWRFAQKVARAAAVGATGLVLDLAGFQPNQTQTPTAEWAITLLFGPGVGLFFLAAAAVLARYRFDATKQAQVQRILARRAARGGNPRRQRASAAASAAGPHA